MVTVHSWPAAAPRATAVPRQRPRMLTSAAVGFFAVSTRTPAAPTSASAIAPATLATAIAASAFAPTTAFSTSDEPKTRTTRPLAAVRLLTMLSLNDQVVPSPVSEVKSPLSAAFVRHLQRPNANATSRSDASKVHLKVPSADQSGVGGALAVLIRNR